MGLSHLCRCRVALFACPALLFLGSLIWPVVGDWAHWLDLWVMFLGGWAFGIIVVGGAMVFFGVALPLAFRRS